MIFDIDNQESIHKAMKLISDGWYDPLEMYSWLKTSGKTDSPEFWGFTDQILIDTADFLRMKLSQFQTEWDRKCIDIAIKIMGYHCTRHSDKHAYINKGILPFSVETIKLEENQTQAAMDMIEIRSRKPGPCFHISYKYAKDSTAQAFFDGPEILIGCDGRNVGVVSEKSIPLLFHCAIPYATIPKPRDYLTIYFLSAFFNLIDPSDDSSLNFEGRSIDLNGTALAPRHIVEIEEV